ncbi:hypothetical protein MNBD_NITROSPIRAE01-214 [hydrothermal vent metagenome]|uniref:TonB C-terminal domain-containing protein n=1 Tax=hydrothermal vent metagenome TaxID=652676 RepID=A0A3B1CF11_9ZZZZ
MAYLANQEEVLFRKTLKYSIGFYLLLGIMLTVIQLPPLKQLDVNHLSDRVAKLILEPPKIKVTPPPVSPPMLKKEAMKKEKAKPKEKPKVKANKKVAPQKKIVKKEVVPPPTAAQNREIVQKSGLLASFVDDETFGALNEIMEDNRLEEALSQVKVVSAAPKKTKDRKVLRTMSRPQKSKVANKKIASIGSLEKGEGVKLAKREAVTVTQITSSGGGAGGSGHGLGTDVGLQVKGRGSGTTRIDYDAIARVVDKYKGGLVYLYNKELRSNPTLKGTVTVEFSIDENGRVVDAHITTSTMDHARLEKSLARRIKMWKFPKLFSGTIVVTYPFVFFPV